MCQVYWEALGKATILLIGFLLATAAVVAALMVLFSFFFFWYGVFQGQFDVYLLPFGIPLFFYFIPGMTADSVKGPVKNFAEKMMRKYCKRVS